jgi:hypothetical protein
VGEYGKRSVPVAAKGLSPEALARWRSRERSLLSHAPAAHEGGSLAETPAPASQSAAASGGAADAAQRRHATRQKTLIGAQVVFNDLMSTFNCTIRDLSDTGARIKLNAPVQIPQAFILRFGDGRVRQCKVRRRNALELGIEFLG